MKPGTHVCISKQWHKPTITIDVTDTELEIAIPLGDFITALSYQYGNPVGTITQAQHLTKLRAAADAIVVSMKRETTPIA